MRFASVIRRVVLGAAVVSLFAIAIGFLLQYYERQSSLYESNQNSLESHRFIANQKNLERQTSWLNNTSTFQIPESVTENIIYMSIKTRSASTQTIVISTLTRNNSWTSSVIVFGPGISVIEQWKSTPTRAQIENMILSTKKYLVGEGRRYYTLHPRESIITSSEFIFPNPLDLDFWVNLSIQERGSKSSEESTKFVVDSISLSSAFLNSIPVQ